jgi:hypothetical protein
MAANPEALRLIRLIGQTPGFQLQGTGDQSYKVSRLLIPGYSTTAPSAKISGRAHDRQLDNVVTRLRRIGWTEDLYNRCQEITRQHRLEGTDPTEDHQRALLEALNIEPIDDSDDGATPGLPVQRRHSGGGTATGSAKATAGQALPAQPADPAEAPPIVIEGGEVRPEIITPERAMDLLVKLAPYQRKLKKEKVDDYAAAMRRGEWALLASDPICIDTNGQTANGQHRLQAVVETLTPQPFYVAYSVPPEMYRNMDRGAKRTTADMLYGAGEVSTTALAGVARQAFLWFNHEQDQWKSVPAITEPQIFATLESHPDLRESVRHGRIGKGLKISSVGSMFVHYLIARKMGGDIELVTRWYQAIGGMALEVGTPGHTLGLYLLKNGTGGTRRTALAGRTRRDLEMYLLMQAWNNTCLGKEVRNISWKSDFVIARPLEPTANNTFPPVA